MPSEYGIRKGAKGLLPWSRVEERLSGLLPAHFEVDEAVLMGEHEPDVWRVLHTLPFQR